MTKAQAKIARKYEVKMEIDLMFSILDQCTNSIHALDVVVQVRSSEEPGTSLGSLKPEKFDNKLNSTGYSAPPQISVRHRHREAPCNQSVSVYQYSTHTNLEAFALCSVL